MQNQTLALNTPIKVLRIDASVRVQDSVSRSLADALLQGLQERAEQVHVIHRDLAAGVPLLDADWTAANFTDPEQRSPAQQATLATSDALVQEVQTADVLVIATPLYNFGVPASLKTWFDQIARARLTFRYTENGAEGLLTGKKAYVLVASGGTQVGSEIDFATPWLRFMLGFLGISDVEVIAADQVLLRGEAARQEAEARIADTLERDYPLRAVA